MDSSSEWLTVGAEQHLTLQLPAGTRSAELDVYEDNSLIHVELPGLDSLSLPLPPNQPADPTLRCKFDKASCQLTLILPLPPCNTVARPMQLLRDMARDPTKLETVRAVTAEAMRRLMERKTTARLSELKPPAQDKALPAPSEAPPLEDPDNELGSAPLWQEAVERVLAEGSTALEHLEWPQWESRNPQVDQATDTALQFEPCMSMDTAGTLGRQVHTTQTKAPGSLLHCELPLAAAALPGCCDWCMGPMSSRVSCSSCASTWCSKRCRKSAATQHAPECGLPSEWLPPARVLLAVRIVQAGLLSATDSLTCCEQHHSAAQLQVEALLAVQLFQLQVGPKGSFKLFHRLLMKLRVNTMVISRPQMAQDDTGISHVRAGIALYAAGSCFNHSCSPTALLGFEGRRMELRASTEIPSGEQVRRPSQLPAECVMHQLPAECDARTRCSSATAL